MIIDCQMCKNITKLRKKLKINTRCNMSLIQGFKNLGGEDLLCFFPTFVTTMLSNSNKFISDMSIKIKWERGKRKIPTIYFLIYKRQPKKYSWEVHKRQNIFFSLETTNIHPLKEKKLVKWRSGVSIPIPLAC